MDEEEYELDEEDNELDAVVLLLELIIPWNAGFDWVGWPVVIELRLDLLLYQSIKFFLLIVIKILKIKLMFQ